MHFRNVRLLIICLLCVTQPSLQESSSKKTGGKKDGSNSAAIEELKKQVANIVQELNLLKEKQALQTGIKVPGKCFLADATKKNFHAANDDCMTKGGVLSTPLSGAENNKLHQYAGETIGPEEHIWVGINDMVTEGDWFDQSGSALRFKNWETEITHQPDGGHSQNCATLSPTTGRWFDESCRAERAFVCEFNIV
ncbi:tetranectin isoform X2 [Clupea harengus]|uniref:Tetranectin isoform X2 n=1 Tax=Clupea harengus TaxID=7950 RepID=A0A6P3W412_CLUHA|nr:tetranectin isoform X2 [Clupea harengus]